MGRILRTHFAQFGGYSNNQLLFGAASQELSMFLNDNDCENIDAVYAIARFLFEKKAVAGAPYKFSTPHIFEKEPDYPMTLRGLMIHLARSNGGLLYASDAKDYLQKTMLTYGGIGQLLQLGSSIPSSFTIQTAIFLASRWESMMLGVFGCTTGWMTFSERQTWHMSYREILTLHG